MVVEKSFKLELVKIEVVKLTPEEKRELKNLQVKSKPGKINSGKNVEE